jgi:hypothetical protein
LTKYIQKFTKYNKNCETFLKVSGKIIFSESEKRRQATREEGIGGGVRQGQSTATGEARTAKIPHPLQTSQGFAFIMECRVPNVMFLFHETTIYPARRLLSQAAQDSSFNKITSHTELSCLHFAQLYVSDLLVALVAISLIL